MKMFVLSCLALLVASTSSAQVRSEYRAVESRVFTVERKMEMLTRRIELLENELVNTRPPLYQEKAQISCLLVDGGYSKTFLGTARNKIEAEVAVRNACEKEVHSSYCGTPLKCSSGVKEPQVEGYVCIMTDSGYSRTFKGEGKNEIEAEAKAKQACQAAVHASYCGKATTRCEAF